MTSQLETETLPRAVIFVDLPLYLDDLGEGSDALLDHHRILILDHGHQSAVDTSSYDHVENAAFDDPAELARVARVLAQQFDVAAVFNFSEASVLPAARLAAAFKVKGLSVDTALLCRDKFLMNRTLNKSRIPVPRSFVAEPGADLQTQIDRIGGFPVVCKPLMGLASVGVIRADDSAALGTALNTIRQINKFVIPSFFDDERKRSQVLVQAFVPGIEVAVDGFVNHGVPEIIAIIDKPGIGDGPYFGDGTHVLPSALPRETREDITKVAGQAVLALGINDSAFHLEARLSGSEVFVLEVAGRLGFMYGVHDALGIDQHSISMALKMAKQPEVNVKRQRYAGNHTIMANKLGRFREITNLDDLLQDPDVLDIPIFMEPGTRVAPAPLGTNYIGFIRTVADSYDEALAAVQRTLQKMQIVID